MENINNENLINSLLSRIDTDKEFKDRVINLILKEGIKNIKFKERLTKAFVYTVNPIDSCYITSKNEQSWKNLISDDTIKQLRKRENCKRLVVKQDGLLKIVSICCACEKECP